MVPVGEERGRQGGGPLGRGSEELEVRHERLVRGDGVDARELAHVPDLDRVVGRARRELEPTPDRVRTQDVEEKTL